MTDPIKDYAKRVAEEVWNACRQHRHSIERDLGEKEIDAIIATVEPPVMQHHAAPTCPNAIRMGNELVCPWTRSTLPPGTTEPAPVAAPTPDIDPYGAPEKLFSAAPGNYRDPKMRALAELLHAAWSMPAPLPEEMRQALAKAWRDVSWGEPEGGES